MQASVKTVAALCKRLMGAFLDHQAILHDDDLVGIDDGRKAMGDDDDGAAAHRMVERLLHGRFGLGIERGRGFVEQQDRRLAYQRAGNRKALPLAAGQCHAVFADGRVVVLSERLRSLVSGDKRRPVRRVASARLPTEFGDFDIHVYESPGAAETHVALVRGDLGDGHNVLSRVHSSCVTGDIFHSARCDCGPQLHEALGRIAGEGRGVLIYLNQEGRGIGLANKIRAYALQERGADTVEANHQLGFPADAREYGVAVRLLHQLGLMRIRLMTNNPRKLDALRADGIDVVERVALESGRNPHNERYLAAKAAKLGHMLNLP